MAGVGYSQPQYWYINNQNPALLVYNTFTTFEAGVIAETRTIKSDSTSQKEKGGNMNYLVLSFPIKRDKWTTSVGLMPFTNVDYRLQYLDYHLAMQSIFISFKTVQKCPGNKEQQDHLQE